MLAQAFGIKEGSPAAFALKDLESMCLGSGYEIGTTSVRLFVAYYTGLPFETPGQEMYMPQSATDILLARGNLTTERVAYLETYTIAEGELPRQAQQPGKHPLTLPRH